MKSELDFFLLHHRIFLVKNFYQCNGDYFGVKTKYETNYKDRNNSPKFSCDVLIEVVNLFEETGSVFKPPENTVQTTCGQIEQVYIKTENPDEEYEDNTEVHCPEEFGLDPPEIGENNVTHIRDVTQVQNGSTDTNTSNDSYEQFPPIQEFKSEIVDEEPEELPELCFLCKKRLKRNHTETEHHDPEEEFSDGSSSKCEGPKPAKVPKKDTGKNEVKGKKRSTTDESVMQTALQAILQDRLRIREAAEVFGIPIPTLYSRLKKVKTELPESQNVSLMMGLKKKEMVNKFASQQIFTMPQEGNLVTNMLEFSKLNFGLTLHVVRELAYQYAVSINQKIPTSWETNKKAGKRWARSFLKRHGEITIQRPEDTLRRKNTFTRENVEMFFKNLKDIRIQHYFEPSRIFSLDETEMSTVPQIFVGKSKEAGKCVTTERGETVTIYAFVNAAGQSLPPVYLFSRRRNSPAYMEGCIEESVAFCNGTGSMDAETFLKTLEHLKTQTAASKDDQILLIFHNHVLSHLSVDAMIFCKENGIHILALPLHTIHRTKPFDLSVFSSFETYCASAFDAWMSAETGNRVKIHNIARLSVEPLQKCMTSENIKGTFMKTGIYPMDSSKLLSFFETTEGTSSLIDKGLLCGFG